MSGIFAIFGHPHAAAITAAGLHALQHRGEEGAGVVSFDGQKFYSERRLGLVADHFAKREIIDGLPGNSAVGYVRNSPPRDESSYKLDPFIAELDFGAIALSDDGGLTNRLTLRKHLMREGAMMLSDSDAELMLHLLARSRRGRLTDRVIECLRQLEGSYCFVALAKQQLVARHRGFDSLSSA